MLIFRSLDVPYIKLAFLLSVQCAGCYICIIGEVH